MFCGFPMPRYERLQDHWSSGFEYSVEFLSIIFKSLLDLIPFASLLPICVNFRELFHINYSFLATMYECILAKCTYFW